MPAVAVPVPDGGRADTAAALMLQGMTAHYLATDTYAGPARRHGARARRRPAASACC